MDDETLTGPPVGDSGPPGTSPVVPQDTTRLSPQDAMARLNAERDALSRGTSSGAGGTGPGTPPPTEHPVQSFWNKLLYGVKGKNRTLEILRSVGRGVVDTGNAVMSTVHDVGSEVLQRNPNLKGLTAPDVPGSLAASSAVPLDKPMTQLVSQDTENRLLGKRSDDPLASFIEDATSFYTGWEAAGLAKVGEAGQALKELSSGEGVGKLARAGYTALHGAITDFAFFDPHQAQFAELLAKAPIPLVQPLGEFMSVKGDDSELAARTKRAAFGILPAATIDGLIASGRLLKRLTTLKSVSSPAEREALLAGVQADAKVVQDVANGTHIAEGQHLVPVPDGNGGYTVAVNPDSPLVEHLAGPDVVATPATETAPAVVPMPDAPHFADRAEAEAQTETLNAALNANTSPNVNGHLTDEQVQQISDVWHRLMSGEDPADVKKLLEGTHFNFSYAFDDIEKAKALIESISEVMKAPLDAAQHTEGVPVAETIARARQMLGSLSPESAATALAASLKSGGTDALSVRSLAGDMLLKDLGQQIGDRYLALSGRPFDAVAHEQARFQMESFFRLQEALAGSNSEIGRSLRILQERNNPLIRAPMAEVEQAAAQARSAAVSEAQDAVATAKKEVARAEKRAAKQAAKGEAKANPTDTIGPNANDFLLNRARIRVENALKRLEAVDPQYAHDAQAARQRGQEVVAGAQAQRDSPLALTADQQAQLAAKRAKQPRNPIEELSTLIEQSQTQLDAAVERAKAPKPKVAPQPTPFDAAKAEARTQAAIEPNPLRTEKVKPEPLYLEPSTDGNPLDGVTGSATGGESPTLGKSTRKKSAGILTSAEDVPVAYTAGMSHRDITELARMFRLSGGDLRNTEALVNGLRAIKPVGTVRKIAQGAMEVFINGLLSAFTTTGTALTSNIGVSIAQAAGKIAGGAATLNAPLAREGWDILWGNMRYIGDGIQMARAAFREGRSILDPHPMYEVIPKKFGGSIVRAPTRFLIAGDEFTRQVNYRSFVRAKALRMGRQLGMDGEALQQYAENAVKHSTDPQTGIGRIGSALDYAEVPTLSGPLRPDSFGAAFRRFTNDRQELKLIAPFIRASSHIFNYVSMRTPVLNLLNRQAREIMRAGGEEAAALHSQSVIAGMLYAGGMYEAMQGNLTGAGPSDPKLRALWLKNHQPYSVRAGNHWVSYLRADPLAMPLGLIADAHTIYNEHDNGEATGADIATAIVSSLAVNLANKSYLRGLTEFMSAWGSGDSHEVNRWLRNFTANAAVPQVVAKANPDPYWREVRGYADAIMARVPGFSTQLDPRYNLFGEPELKQTGALQTSLNPFPVRSSGSSVEDDLLALKHGLSPAPEVWDGGIDLTDKRWDTKGVGKSPWRRFNELVAHPKYGPSLREQMEALVKSDRWKRASVGTEMVPGGERWLLASATQQAAYARAKQQLFSEYPNLIKAVREAGELKAANLTQSDGTKVQAIRQKYQQLGLPPLKK